MRHLGTLTQPEVMAWGSKPRCVRSRVCAASPLAVGLFGFLCSLPALDRHFLTWVFASWAQASAVVQ